MNVNLSEYFWVKWLNTGLPKAWLENDPDLDSLRDRPRFQAFLAQLKES